jgi:hypothetical protein
MTLVKKQYNGRELPVFENMDEAREHFSKARKTILGVMIAFSACYSFFVAVLASFSQQLGLDGLIVGFVFGFAIYSASCCTEADIRAPKQFKVFYSEKDKKWLLFPADEYPAVAFVRECGLDKKKTVYATINEKQLEINVKKEYLVIAGYILAGILFSINVYAACAVVIVAVVAKIVIHTNSNKAFRIIPYYLISNRGRN